MTDFLKNNALGITLALFSALATGMIGYSKFSVLTERVDRQDEVTKTLQLEIRDDLKEIRQELREIRINQQITF